MSKISIFTNQTTDGQSLSFVPTGNVNGPVVVQTLFTIYGVFGGASAQLQFKADDGNWYSTSDDPFVDTGVYNLRLSSNIPYRLDLSSASGSTNVSSVLYNAQFFN